MTIYQAYFVNLGGVSFSHTYIKKYIPVKNNWANIIIIEVQTIHVWLIPKIVQMFLMSY